MKSFNLFKGAAVAASVLLLASCAQKATVQGVIKDAPESDVVVSLLNVNTLETIDTVKTDAKGRYTVKVDVEKGRPEFIYIYRNGVRVAPLLLNAGDKVSVESDTLGNFTVSGSEEAELYAQVENDYAAFLAKVEEYAMAGDSQSIRNEYISYYRGRLKFIAEHPYSLSNIPVVYQTIGDMPVFSQQTDAIHFNHICDSLEVVYPESKYVKALRKAADERLNILDLQSRLDNAETIGYPDIQLPDITAKTVKLSEVDAKVTLVHFWSLTAEQKMMNLDILLPIYKDFHDRGFEIYQVALEPDKTAWATTVKSQNLPWVNVCDVNGSASAYIALYALASVPTSYLLKDGELVEEPFEDEASLRALLNKLL